MKTESQDAPDYFLLGTVNGFGIDCPRCKGWTSMFMICAVDGIGSCLVCGWPMRVPEEAVEWAAQIQQPRRDSPWPKAPASPA